MYSKQRCEFRLPYWETGPGAVWRMVYMEQAGEDAALDLLWESSQGCK